MNYQDIRELSERAASGDDAALRELQSLSATWANRANSRIKEFEKRNFKANPAYVRAKDYLQETQGRSNFSRSKKLEGADLEEQIDELYRFLYGETPTTVYEERKRLSGIDKQIEENFLEVPEDMDEESFKRKMVEFYESDWWNEYKKAHGRIGSPKDIILRAQEAIASGASIRRLNEAYDAYLAGNESSESGETTVDDFLSVFENWERI